LKWKKAVLIKEIRKYFNKFSLNLYLFDKIFEILIGSPQFIFHHLRILIVNNHCWLVFSIVQYFYSSLDLRLLILILVLASASLSVQNHDHFDNLILSVLFYHRLLLELALLNDPFGQELNI